MSPPHKFRATEFPATPAWRRRARTGPRSLEVDYLRTDFVHCLCMLALTKIAARQSKLVGSLIIESCEL